MDPFKGNTPLLEFVIGAAAIIVIAVIITLILRRKRSQRSRSAGRYVNALKDLIRGDEDSAFGRLKKVVREDTGNIDAYLQLGDIFRRRGEPARALQIHRQLMIRGDLKSSDKLELLKSLALDYIQSGKDERAIATLQELIYQAKKNLWAHEHLLDIYERLGRWSQALTLQEAIFKITGTGDDGLLALYEVQIGHDWLKKKDYHKARLKYKDALRRDRSCAPAYLGLGDANEQEGRLEEAIESWKELLVKVPDKGYLAFGKLEKSLFDQGRFGEITKLYRDLLERDPDNLRALLALANIHEKKGDLAAAIEACERAVKIDPGSMAARSSLVKFYRHRGEDQKLNEHLAAIVASASDTFSCQNCDYQSTEPLWLCPKCRAWRSFQL
jgi:lipopolysaccharide biosynthesis regulator YciM